MPRKKTKRAYHRRNRPVPQHGKKYWEERRTETEKFLAEQAGADNPSHQAPRDDAPTHTTVNMPAADPWTSDKRYAIEALARAAQSNAEAIRAVAEMAKPSDDKRSAISLDGGSHHTISGCTIKVNS